MKSIVAAILGFYFFCGMLILPHGDFEFLKELPAMYHHCRITEHADMDFVDFITDHLIDIDGLFDTHPFTDTQRPHKPPVFHSHNNVNLAECKSFFEIKTLSYYSASNFRAFNDPEHLNTFFNNVFRPPIG